MSGFLILYNFFSERQVFISQFKLDFKELGLKAKNHQHIS